MATTKNKVDLDDRLPSIAAKLPREAEIDQMKIARRIATSARRRAPRIRTPIVTPSFYRTRGWVASSIEVEGSGDETEVGVGPFIAPFLEFGTENMRARPFLQPALWAEEPGAIALVTRTLRSL